MNYGFFRVCSCSPEIQVSNTEFNAKKIIECVKTASEKKASIIVFPELSVTGYTCHDLFLQKMLQDSAINAIEEICEKTKVFSHALFYYSFCILYYPIYVLPLPDVV